MTLEDPAAVPTEDEEPEGLVTALRVVLLAIYLADLVIVVDIVTGGSLRSHLATAWRRFDSAVLAPARARAEERRAAAHVVFEAMMVLEEARPT